MASTSLATPGGAPQLEPDESVLSAYPARCRKANGTVAMTPCRMVFAAAEPTAPDKNLTLDLDQVQSYHLNKPKPGDERALIQLVCAGYKVVVELTSPDRKWEHQRELAEWIQAREAQVAKLRREAQDLEPRLKAVLEDPKLKAQYVHMVEKTNSLSLMEFMQVHAKDIVAAEPLPEARIVDLNALTICSAVARRASGKDVDHLAGLGVDQEEAKAIFRELPAIQLLYNSVVPSTLTTAKFWERCLRSRYFLEATGQPVPLLQRPDPLFDSLPREVAKIEQPEAPDVVATADVDADLTGDPFMETEENPRKKQKLRLVEQLNERCAVAVANATSAGTKPGGGPSEEASSSAAASAAAGENTDGSKADTDRVQQQIAARRESLRRSAAALQEELNAAETSTTPNLASLHLSERALHRLYGQQPSTAENARAPAGAASEATDLHPSLLTWMKAGEGGGGSLPSDAKADKAVSALNPAAIAQSRWVLKAAIQDLLLDEQCIAQSEVDLPADVSETLAQVRTLLAHFWASRCSEDTVRSRICKALQDVLPRLEAWQALQTRKPSSADLEPDTLRNAARSLLAPIRRTLAVHANFQKAAKQHPEA
mmetsp:Transcript_17720/g.41201  ORF Transcript_17720/g.41201 Transcript_17720/m.41201 type:complete len:600 (+) Transcript_17720:146-1945(+)